mgnify:CR=1 FL=1|jgi:hypothetical protein
MTETTQAELLPCPFCGGPADLRGHQAPEFWVGCSAIGCKATTEGFGDMGRAITAWNTRHRTQALADAAAEAPNTQYVLSKIVAKLRWQAEQATYNHDVLDPKAAEILTNVADEVAAWNTRPLADHRALVEAARPFAEWAGEAAKMVKTIESVDGDVHPIIRRIAELGKPLLAALKETDK